MLAGKDSKVLYIGCRIKILSKRGAALITQNKPNWVNNPRKWIWMLVGFIIIEKFLENGILVPVLLKLPFGDLTSNILYKGIEVLLVLGLNIWLIKQKLYFSVNVTLKTTLFSFLVLSTLACLSHQDR